MWRCWWGLLSAVGAGLLSRGVIGGLVHYHRTFAVISIFVAASFLGSGQEVLSVDQSTLDQHVDHRAAPVYPPIAKAARIQGTVVFEVRIGVTGKIESSRVVSGPAMLQQAAI